MLRLSSARATLHRGKHALARTALDGAMRQDKTNNGSADAGRATKAAESRRADHENILGVDGEQGGDATQENGEKVERDDGEQ